MARMTNKDKSLLKYPDLKSDMDRFKKKVTAADIMKRIRLAGFDLKDPYARTYFDAFPRAEAEYGERGVRVQILYFFNNQKARGPEQQRVKKELLKLANEA